ncbi:hypothetical protein ACNJKD_09890 [Edwardsiella tarda]|uniref:hypothetical protein n=1 Tax=Edwardsiella tarda TaxID=636 RepID=UPI003A8C64F4
MEEKVFGVKTISAPKILFIMFFVAALALVFSLVSMNFIAIAVIVFSLLLLRILYEFLMSSFKSTEHLYRIAESMDKKDPRG